MSRSKIFDNISEIGQNLLIQLYGDKSNFISTSDVSELEEYIISYDNNIDHMGILVSIGKRIGILLDIMPEFDTAVAFYDILFEIITKKGKDSGLGIILNMNKLEFNDYLDSIGKGKYKDNEFVFDDRLYLYANDFHDALLKEYI
jgi:hypothetical protein